MNTPSLPRRELPQILLLALPFALAAAWWDKVPATVVTHWNLHGQPDGWMPRLPGLLAVPTCNAVLCLVLGFLPRIDPRLRRDPAAATARHRRTLRVLRLTLTGFLTVASTLVIAVAAGWRLDVAAFVYYGVSILLLVLGNFIRRLEPNYLFGIRTPWTLEDDATWRATHRLAGRWTVFGALALLAAGPFAGASVRAGLLLGDVLTLSVASVGYSAWFFRRGGGLRTRG